MGSLDATVNSTPPRAERVTDPPLNIPADDVLRDLLWNLTDGTSCTVCRHDVSATFTSLLIDYIRYEKREIAAQNSGNELPFNDLKICRQYRRALYAILQRNHGDCVQQH